MADAVRPSLRFQVGDRIECWCHEKWLLGVVVQLWWAHPSWPQGRVAPYQIKLQDGSLVFAPEDTEQFVREAAPLLEGQSGEQSWAGPISQSGTSGSTAAPGMPNDEEITWRKAIAPNGQPYWYHPVTKESRWDEPPEEQLGSALMPRSNYYMPVLDADVQPHGAVLLPNDVREAAAEGNISKVDAWLRSSPDNLRAVDVGGRTLLMAAAQGPMGIGVVNKLITAGAPLEVRDHHGCTALMYAALRGRVTAVKSLVSAGAAIGATDGNGGSALHMAAFLGHAEVVKVLVNANADLSLKHSAIGLTAHEIAIKAGNAAVLSVLNKDTLAAPVIDARNRREAMNLEWLSSSTARELADKMGQQIRQLAGNARSVVLAQHARKSPRVLSPMLAGADGLLDAGLVTVWLQQGGDPDAVAPTNEHGSLLVRAASAGSDVVVRLLVEARANLEQHDMHGQSALLRAAIGCHASTCTILLEAKASPNTADERGITPLLAGASAGSAEVVNALLQAGASCDVRDLKGNSGLQLAERAGHSGIAEILRNANRSSVRVGKSPVDRSGSKAGSSSSSCRSPAPSTLKASGSKGVPSSASASPPLSIIKELMQLGRSPEDERTWTDKLDAWLKAGGDVDAFEPSMGRTLLMFAAQENRPGAVRLLLAAGASPDIIAVHGSLQTTRPGCSALVLAGANGSATIVELLLEAKASPDPPLLSADGKVGWSALSVAASSGYIDCARLLMNAGARTDILHPTAGLDALQIARQNGHFNTAMLLESASTLISSTLTAETNKPETASPSVI